MGLLLINKTSGSRRAAVCAACVVLLLWACGWSQVMAPVVHANTINVNSILDSSDPSQCTLHDAILAANTNTQVQGCAAGDPYPAMDTINVGFSRTYCLLHSCTIILSQSLPAISEDVTIHGVSSFMRISGANAYRIFDLQAVVVTISNLQIADGYTVGVSTAGYGGAINTSS